MKEEKLKEILEKLLTDVKNFIKEELEDLMRAERQVYLQEHPENKANGFYERRLLTKFGEIEDLKVPRTRQASFKPVILPYRKRAFLDLGEFILYLFASGSSLRDINRILRYVYGAYYSSSSLSRLSEILKEDIEAFKKRSLKRFYPFLFIDSCFISLRRKEFKKEPVYIVLGIDERGNREIMGFYLFGAEGESSENWKEVFKDLKGRGLKEVLLVISDDLNGIEEAVKEEYPQADWQLCNLHFARGVANKVRKKDRGEVMCDLKQIYRSKDEEEARAKAEQFIKKWAKIYPRVCEKLRRRLENLIKFLEYPQSIRRYIYTVNMLERLIKEIKRRTKVIEVFWEEGSLEKVLYLVLKDMGEVYKERALVGFEEAREEIESLRRQRYNNERHN